MGSWGPCVFNSSTSIQSPVRPSPITAGEILFPVILGAFIFPMAEAGIGPTDLVALWLCGPSHGVFAERLAPTQRELLGGPRKGPSKAAARNGIL